jgi:hypothetical protein
MAVFQTKYGGGSLKTPTCFETITAMFGTTKKLVK